MLKLSKKFALPLIAVLIIGTGVGAYFLFRNFQLPRYFVDRYPELLEYCDTEESEGGLKISCKALMLDIKPNVSDGIPSLTSLIIANDEELREYTITEKEEVFAWTNEVLQFKKLKPIIINLQYVKKNPITYSIQGITFDDIPETYIQDIVNRDIEEIMGIVEENQEFLGSNLSSIDETQKGDPVETISPESNLRIPTDITEFFYLGIPQNSLDFCPSPQKLPLWVTRNVEYETMYYINILPEKTYNNWLNKNSSFNNSKNLFMCKSSFLRQLDLCNLEDKKVISTEEPLSLLSGSNLNIKWSEKLSPLEIKDLKEISLLTDSLYVNPAVSASSIEILNKKLSALRKNGEINEIVFCSFYDIYEQLTVNNKKLSEETGYIRDTVLTNLNKISSSVCAKILKSENVDILGLYLELYFRDKSITNELLLFEKCTNLNNYIR